MLYFCIDFRMTQMKLIFRIVSFLEGVSYLLLLFIATPVKYLYDNPEYVKLLGMPHGLLFMLYVAIAIVIKKDLNWSGKDWELCCCVPSFRLARSTSTRNIYASFYPPLTGGITANVSF